MHLFRRAALLALVLLAAAAAQIGTAHASIACPPGFTFTPLTPEQAALAPADFNGSGAVCVREQGQHLVVADNVDDDVYRYPWMLPCPGSFYAIDVHDDVSGYDPRDMNTDNYLCAKMLLVNPMTLLMVVHDNPCAWPCPPPKKLEIE